jgi:hypothetical protein
MPALALAAYLKRHGWGARRSRVEGVAILSKRLPDTDEPVEFILPVASGFSDEQRRVADALRVIEAVERRPLADIADDVRSIMRPSGAGRSAMPRLDSARRAPPPPRSATQVPTRSISRSYANSSKTASPKTAT